jgi:threonine dehydrogenase-like Zn-dependent dehydrogenase
MGVRVIGIDPVGHRCEVARSIGIPEVLHIQSHEQAEAIMSLTDKKGADIVIDATGLSSVIETAVSVTARYGTVVLLGSPRSDYVTNVTPMLNAIHMRNLKVIGTLNQLYPYDETQGVRITKRRGMDHITKLMLDKSIDVNQLISHIIQPKDIMSAYDGLMNHKEEYTSVLIDWTK